MRFLVSFLAFSAFVAGCAAPEPYIIKSKVNHDEMQSYLVSSNSKLVGQAFLRTRGGDVKFGAGSIVYLYPAVAYSKEINSIPWYEKVQGRDPEWNKYVRSTVADGGGNFEFGDIGSGLYYVESRVTWEIPGKYGSSTQGGLVRRVINVSRNSITKVVLTE